MLGDGSMPPADHEPRPTAAETARLVQWIDQAVFDLDCGRMHDPGHVTIRRLNRTEYNNTIRDLVGVALRPADDFPSDDVGNGFDNMGDVLSLSPLLLEKYLTAAESISSVALFGFDLKRPPVREFDNDKLAVRGSARLVRRPYTRHKQFLLPSFGLGRREVRLPPDGGLRLCVVAAAQPDRGRSRQDERANRRQTRKTFAVKGDLRPSRYEMRLALSKGTHTFSAKFVNSQTEPPAPPLPRKPGSRSTVPGRKGQAEPNRTRSASWSWTVSSCRGRSGSIRRNGRLDGSRRASGSCSPLRTTDGSAHECATRILIRVRDAGVSASARAGRDRPVRRSDAGGRQGRPVRPGHPDGADGHSGLAPLPVSRRAAGQSGRGSRPVPITAYELASRLRIFCGAACRTRSCSALAADGSLLKPDVLEAQVRRMLRDPKSRALVANFAVQWLNLAQLDAVRPSRESSRISTAICGPTCGGRPSCFSSRSSMRIAAFSIC